MEFEGVAHIMKKKLLIALSVLFAALPAMAQFDVQWNTIDGGGAMNSAGGTFQVSGTIGQPDASAPLTGGAFQLTGGFWAVSQVCFCLGDMNQDGKKDGRDIQQFVGCMLAGGNCACADVDGANGVTVADVSAFVSGLLAGSSCH